MVDLLIIMNGWLFDIYHLKDRIILWIKNKNGHVKRLEYLMVSFNIYSIRPKIRINRLGRE